MIDWIKEPLRSFLILLVLVIMFHLCLLFKVIPYSIAWGGRLTNDQEMYAFESLSLLINLFLGWILAMKGNWVPFKFGAVTIRVILWVFFALFLLNTIGNLFATTTFEKCFALITAFFAYLLWQIQKQYSTDH